MSIATAIERIGESQALEYLKRYYQPGKYEGAHFESIGSEGGDPNRFSAADLYATSALGVPVPAKAGIVILGDGADIFNDLLVNIPDTPIASLSATEFELHLGEESKALELWDRLRRNGPGEKRWGVGKTTTSKIMARKRPHLIPIQDSVVDRVIGRTKADDSWRLWWEALHGNAELEALASRLRVAIAKPELSTLRVFDVVLWMHGKSNKDVGITRR